MSLDVLSNALDQPSCNDKVNTTDNIPNINAAIAFPLLAFFTKEIIPKTIANTPKKKDALLSIGIKLKLIPTIPKTKPHVPKPLF